MSMTSRLLVASLLAGIENQLPPIVRDGKKLTEEQVKHALSCIEKAKLKRLRKARRVQK